MKDECVAVHASVAVDIPKHPRSTLAAADKWWPSAPVSLSTPPRLSPSCRPTRAYPSLPAGDSRAVLSRAGRAIDLSVDHKPQAPSERQRIESSGGFYVCPQGRLNGELGVSRAIGDFHLKLPDQLLSPAAAAAPLSPAAAPAAAASQGGMLPSSAIAAADVTITTSPTCSPLTAEPEVTTHQLQADDEFCILGCDGLWDVFSSQRAVEYARAR